MAGMPMNNDPGHFLNELPIWKLKLVAQEYRIDVTACRYKRDYVAKIASKKVTEEQVRGVLSRVQQARETAEDKASANEIEEIGKDIENIAGRSAEPADMPSEDEKVLDRHLDEALIMRPSFFEVDSANQDAMNRMIVGDYRDAIKANRQARLRCLDQFSSFQVYSTAVSIRASEELLAKLPKERGDVVSGLKTSLAAAKLAFVHGTPRQREETIESLESLATGAYEAYWGNSDRAETELLDLIKDYESFGTRTEEARRYLDIAASAKRSQNLEEHSRMLAQAREAAERAKAARGGELEGTYHIVRAAAAEARASGADVADAEKRLADAKTALETGSFAKAAQLMADIERAADAAHVERLKADKELEKAKAEQVRSVEADCSPVLREAASYGMDVQQTMLYAGQMRTALDSKDVVSAAKFARRVREIVDGMEKDLDRKRIEVGVATKTPDAKCGKCGQESLYRFPGSVQKCASCGHSFSVSETEEKPPQPAQIAVDAESPEKPEESSEKRKRWFKW